MFWIILETNSFRWPSMSTFKMYTQQLISSKCLKNFDIQIQTPCPFCWWIFESYRLQSNIYHNLNGVKIALLKFLLVIYMIEKNWPPANFLLLNFICNAIQLLRCLQSIYKLNFYSLLLPFDRIYSKLSYVFFLQILYDPIRNVRFFVSFAIFGKNVMNSVHMALTLIKILFSSNTSNCLRM